MAAAPVAPKGLTVSTAVAVAVDAAAAAAVSSPPVIFVVAGYRSVAGWAVGQAQPVLLETFAVPRLPFAPVETSADPRLPLVLAEASPSFVVVSEHRHSRTARGCLRRSFAILLEHWGTDAGATVSSAQSAAKLGTGSHIDNP